MHFTYYTDKTVSQCMMALNERLHAKNGKLEGWTEKKGGFSLAVTSTVMRRFSRRTELHAKVERDNNITVVRGAVSDGIDLQRRAVIYGMLVLVGVLIILRGGLFPGLIAFLAPLALNIPLEGDYNNSQVLIAEVQRTLKARETPPPAVKKSAETRKPSVMKKPTVARKPASTKKPVS